MKELSIEKKTYDGNYKAYIELINRLENVKDAIKKQNYGIAMDVLCKPYTAFQVTTHSELKESVDERIRKDIIRCLKYSGIQPDRPINPHVRTTMKDALAWLEKQELLTKEKALKNSPFVEQKPADLPKGEDYGIDGLYAAIDILQKTLGKVDGYQSDDGILEHKCAIEAVNRLYKQKPAWSEEDDIMAHDIDYALRCQITYSISRLQSMSTWINNLKDRVQPQPKQEWSEDTQQWIDAIIFDYESWYDADKDHRTTIQAKINILKSLKDRYFWKPSDEQLCALEHAKCINANDAANLATLYNDLKIKKLMEE